MENKINRNLSSIPGNHPNYVSKIQENVQDVSEMYNQRIISGIKQSKTDENLLKSFDALSLNETKLPFINVSKKVAPIPLPKISPEFLEQSGVKKINKSFSDPNAEIKNRIINQRTLIENSRGHAGKKTLTLNGETINQFCKVFGIVCKGSKSDKIDMLLKTIDNYQSQILEFSDNKIASPVNYDEDEEEQFEYRDEDED